MLFEKTAKVVNRTKTQYIRNLGDGKFILQKIGFCVPDPQRVNIVQNGSAIGGFEITAQRGFVYAKKKTQIGKGDFGVKIFRNVLMNRLNITIRNGTLADGLYH